MNIQEIRQKYPDYNDLSDQELADKLHGAAYSDMPKEQFYQKIGMQPSKTQGTYSAQLPQQGVPESQFQKMEPDQKPYEYVGGQIEGDDTEGFGEKTWNTIGAYTQAGYAGIMGLGSTIQKIADSIGVAPEGTAEAAQKQYDEAIKIYEQGDVPGTGVAKFAGELGALAVGGKGIGKLAGATGKLLAPVVSGASKIPGGSKIMGATKRIASPKTIKGQYAQSAAKGAGASSSVGLLNVAGQDPDDIINEQNAAMGAVLGAPLGAAGRFVSRYAKDTAAYQKATQEAQDVGYKGPVVARDFGDEAVKDIKVAWMDNIIDDTLRGEQLDALSDAAMNLGRKLLTVSEKQGVSKMGQLIRRIEQGMSNKSSQMHQAVFDQAKKQGIKNATLKQSKKQARDILESYDIRSKDLKTTLSKLAKSDEMSLDQLNKIKGKDVWSAAEKYNKASEGSVANAEIADKLKNLYWNITDDIGEALGKNKELGLQWEAAKQYTKGYKSLFNSKNNRKLMNVVEDINDTGDSLKTFYNHLTKSASEDAFKYYKKNLGPTFGASAKHMALRRAMNESYDVGANGLNIEEFLKKTRDLGSDLIDEKSLKALDGMEKIFTRIRQAEKISGRANTPLRLKYSKPQAQALATLGGYSVGGASGAAATAAAVYGGPVLLKQISRSSPLKNLLIGLSKVWGKNPDTTERIMNAITKQFSKGGAVLMRNDDGSATLDMRKKNDK